MPREYAGGAKRTKLVGDITAASTTFTVTDATGWPTGAVGPFAIAFELGVAGEEKVLIASRSGNTLTVAASGRGYDGTTAASHQSGANVDHVITAIDIREATSVTTTEGVAFDSARLGGVSAPLYSTTAQNNAAYVVRAEAKEATVAPNETCTNGVYSALATAGPVVTATIGTSGQALVILTATLSTTPANFAAFMSFTVDGAAPVAATDVRSLHHTSSTANAVLRGSQVLLLKDLTPGSRLFTAVYRIQAGSTSGAFSDRSLIVIPL